MENPITVISDYMGQRTWQHIVAPLVDEDSEVARAAALAELADLGLPVSGDDLEEQLRGAISPTCVLEELAATCRRDLGVVLAGSRSITRLWNHTPRADLDGLSPVEHLRARIESRPEESPWVVASEDEDQLAKHFDASFFQNIASPSELGLPPEFCDGLLAGTQELTAQRVDRRPGRNDPCPCGSGKKFKRCCL